MTTIRKATLDDLFKLHNCVDGVSGLPFIDDDLGRSRYAFVAEAPGKKIVGYVCAHAYYDKKWKIVVGFINKTVISRLYEDTDVIVDLVSAVEKQFNLEELYDMKADLLVSSPKIIDAYILLDYEEELDISRASTSMIKMRKLHNEAQEVIAVAGPGPGPGRPDIFDDVHILHDQLPEAGAEDRANVPLSKSQKRRQKRKGAGAALPSTVHTDADTVAVLKDRVPEAGPGPGPGAAGIIDEVHVPNYHLPEAGAEDRDNVPLSKSQKRKGAGAALPSTVHTNADAVAVLKDRVSEAGAVLDNCPPSEETIPWCDKFSQCGAAVEDTANEKLMKSQIEEDEEEQPQQ